MKRRGFFKALSGAAVGTAAGVAASGKAVDMLNLPDEVHYNGFTIKWTGWKPSCIDLSLYGQWVARPDDKKPLVSVAHPWGADGVYSSFPGYVGFFTAGNQFCTSWTDGQQEAVLCDRAEPWHDTPARRVAAQRFALAAIKKFINENC